MREQGVLPLNGNVLECGEANWYGDVTLKELANDIRRFATDKDCPLLLRQLDEIDQSKSPGMMWEIAKVFWQAFLKPASMTAIDFHGTEQALKLDLNDPVDLQQKFDLVMNLGTIEHVFNVAQALKTIHDHTLPDGLMVHGMPFTGWVDHGFYSFNPTFYWDLAATNGYSMVGMMYTEMRPLKIIQLDHREHILKIAKNGQIGKNALIYAVFRKPKEVLPFRVPIQGYYAGTISRNAAEAWKVLR